MVFSSLIFLYAFFPLSLLAYKLCKTKKAQNAALLVFSLIFYAWGEPKYVFLLMFMALSSWFFALKIEKSVKLKTKRILLFMSCLIDILLIGYFKYASLICSVFTDVPEFIKNIALPIGISFYTFQLLTYVVDVYRGEAGAQKSYWNVLLYAALFHQCIAGPIVRYKGIADELFSPEPRRGELAPGVSRFCAGLAKKALLANPCGALADRLLLSDKVMADASQFAANIQQLENVSVAGAWLGMLAYALHIYLDFSAYSDMAIGMGRMLGFHYPENFNYPYISRSITEFWRRWHISLGSFFRDYVYIPLGGNRGSLPRVIFNTFIVWALTGLWHGASWNFVLWGLWYFVFLMLERYLLKGKLSKVPVLSNLCTLLIVVLGWTIFRFTDSNMMTAVFKSLFGLNGNPLTTLQTSIVFDNHIYLLIVSVFVCTPVMHILREKLENAVYSNGRFSVLWNVVFYSVIPVVLLLISTASLVGDSYNPFIYFQF